MPADGKQVGPDLLLDAGLHQLHGEPALRPDEKGVGQVGARGVPGLHPPQALEHLLLEWFGRGEGWAGVAMTRESMYSQTVRNGLTTAAPDRSPAPPSPSPTSTWKSPCTDSNTMSACGAAVPICERGAGKEEPSSGADRPRSPLPAPLPPLGPSRRPGMPSGCSRMFSTHRAVNLKPRASSCCPTWSSLQPSGKDSSSWLTARPGRGRLGGWGFQDGGAHGGWRLRPRQAQIARLATGPSAGLARGSHNNAPGMKSLRCW